MPPTPKPRRPETVTVLEGEDSQDVHRARADEEFLEAGFDNRPGAPLVIVDARTRTVPLDPRGGFGQAALDGLTNLPVVTLENTTSRRIKGVKLRFKAEPGSHGVSAFATDIPPMGRAVFRSDTLIQGDPARMRIQVIGVGFEDDSLWGAFDTEIDARDETIDVPQYIRPAESRPSDR